MECFGKVVYADMFYSQKTAKWYTKLFVPVGNDVVQVIAPGDKTAFVGVENVSFTLRVKDNQLKLYYNGEEE